MSFGEGYILCSRVFVEIRGGLMFDLLGRAAGHKPDKSHLSSG